MRRPVELKGGSAGGLLMNCLFLKDLETGAEQHWWCGPVSSLQEPCFIRARRTRPKATAGSSRSATASRSTAATCCCSTRSRSREGPDRHDPRADPAPLRPPRQLRAERGVGAGGLESISDYLNRWGSRTGSSSDSTCWLGMEASRDGETVFERFARAGCGGGCFRRSCREVASVFGVSVASVVKWSQRRRATGSAAARPMGGHRKRLLEPHRALVIGRMRAVPDITLKALVAELAEQGIRTSPVSVWRLVRSEGLRFKNAVRRRATAAEGRAAARAVEEVSGPA